ncbi:hypothetical protein Bca4012_077750 [Brassica carinata]
MDEQHKKVLRREKDNSRELQADLHMVKDQMKTKKNQGTQHNLNLTPARRCNCSYKKTGRSSSNIQVRLLCLWDARNVQLDELMGVNMLLLDSQVRTRGGLTHNVSAVCFQPELPIILTGFEDGTVRIWHPMTLENTLNYALEFAPLVT